MRSRGWQLAERDTCRATDGGREGGREGGGEGSRTVSGDMLSTGTRSV